MLKRLQKKGITILVSTPYMDEAALCDRIALIQDGEILEIDTPEAIVNKFPKTIYNIGADNMYKLIQTLQDYEHVYSIFPFGEFVHYTDKRDSFEAVDLKYCLEIAGLTNISLEPTQPIIEDAFMELTKK